jgi:phosphoglycolate phosphatase
VGAGIRTFGLLTGHEAEALLQAGAYRVIHDFTDSALFLL